MTTQAFTADSVKDYIGTPENSIAASTMIVLMKTNKYYTDGSLKRTGTSYTVTRDWGRTAVEQGGASDMGAVLPVVPTPAGFTGALAAALSALVSGAGITADDIGSAWTLAPALLSISATLTAGISTTVLLEVRDLLGTVSTAATIVADTLTTQTLRQAFLTREAVDYRFRRSSGTGTVVIYL